MRFHLDTHVVVWLVDGLASQFPATARSALGNGSLAISPMVRLELGFLHDVGRVSASPDEALRSLRALSIVEDETPTHLVIDHALVSTHPWPHRDPFDRVIMATALAAGAVLITKDRALRRAFPQHTLWDEPE